MYRRAPFPAVDYPIGDNTLALFRQIEAEHPGADAALQSRAVVIAEAMVGPPVAQR